MPDKAQTSDGQCRDPRWKSSAFGGSFRLTQGRPRANQSRTNALSSSDGCAAKPANRSAVHELRWLASSMIRLRWLALTITEGPGVNGA